MHSSARSLLRLASPLPLILVLLILIPLILAGCGANRRPPALSVPPPPALLAPGLTGDIAPVRDPSIIQQNGTFYLFSTDHAHPRTPARLQIRCSADLAQWRSCGAVFPETPSWIRSALPNVDPLWAPDISFFSGLYHLYYAASMLGSQRSLIALATNTTLDPNNPNYHWVDHGPVLTSHAGDDFNAIDPNILADTDGRVWLTYGSYWTGIKQREIDPATGLLSVIDTHRYELAARPRTPDHAIEGASLVRHGSFYYLFLSVDHCCERDLARDDYKEIVGRATSPNGPFLDANGDPLLKGGGTLLLQGNSTWIAPGGGTAYIRTSDGSKDGSTSTGADLFVFHALDGNNHAAATLWVRSIHWQNDWPVLEEVKP